MGYRISHRIRLEDLHKALMSLPFVAEEGKVQLVGESKLKGERSLLLSGGGEVAVEVEAALADRNDEWLLRRGQDEG